MFKQGKGKQGEEGEGREREDGCWTGTDERAPTTATQKLAMRELLPARAAHTQGARGEARIIPWSQWVSYRPHCLGRTLDTGEAQPGQTQARGRPRNSDPIAHVVALNERRVQEGQASPIRRRLELRIRSGAKRGKSMR